MTPREFAITATGCPATAPCPQISSGATPGWNSARPTGIEQAVEHRPNVIAHAVIRGKQVVQIARISRRPPAPPAGASSRPRQPRDVLAQLLEALTVALRPIVRDGARHSVRGRAAQRLRIHRLPGSPFYKIRTTPSPMNEVPSTMKITSESAGRYAPPAMQGPMTAAICGTRRYRRMSEL